MVSLLPPCHQEILQKTKALKNSLKMLLKNHKSLPISSPQAIAASYSTHPFLQ